MFDKETVMGMRCEFDCIRFSGLLEMFYTLLFLFFLSLTLS